MIVLHTDRMRAQQLDLLETMAAHGIARLVESGRDAWVLTSLGRSRLRAYTSLALRGSAFAMRESVPIDGATTFEILETLATAAWEPRVFVKDHTWKGSREIPSDRTRLMVVATLPGRQRRSQSHSSDAIQLP